MLRFLLLPFLITLSSCGSGRRLPCIDAVSPVRTAWLIEAIDRHRPGIVVKYGYGEKEWAYLLKGKNIYLYDCRGREICKAEDPEPSPCLHLVRPGDKGIIIWQDEGVQD